jgi:hypothetical protein
VKLGAERKVSHGGGGSRRGEGTEGMREGGYDHSTIQSGTEIPQ